MGHKWVSNSLMTQPIMNPPKPNPTRPFATPMHHTHVDPKPKIVVQDKNPVQFKLQDMENNQNLHKMKDDQIIKVRSLLLKLLVLSLK